MDQVKGLELVVMVGGQQVILLGDATHLIYLGGMNLNASIEETTKSLVNIIGNSMF